MSLVRVHILKYQERDYFLRRIFGQIKQPRGIRGTIPQGMENWTLGCLENRGKPRQPCRLPRKFRGKRGRPRGRGAQVKA